MKNYIRPTAEVVELSVKESLSRVPSDLAPTGFKKTVAVAATTYNVKLSELGKQTEQIG